MIYTCQRCGYITEYSSHFKKHVNSKKICLPILSNITKEQILLDLLEIQNDKNFTCDKCNKKYKTVETLRIHKKTHFDQNKSDQNKSDQILNNNNDIQVNIQINSPNNIPNIKDFLNENLQYIIDEFIMKCAKKLDNELIECKIRTRISNEYEINSRISGDYKYEITYKKR
jgi:hypothetical protein